MTRSIGPRAPQAEARDEATRHARIRELNDQFRSTLMGGRVMITRGISDLGTAALGQIVEAVRTFSTFDANNDPYDEHDFGSVHIGAAKAFWKIDYYDHRFEYGSPDPSLPGLTGRVLTIMLAEEY